MSTAAAPRSYAAIAFVVAGGALLLGLLSMATEFFEYQRWLYILASAAMAAALVLLAVNDIRPRGARTVVLIAAVGWGLFAAVSLAPALAGALFTLAQVFVLVTSAVAGALVFTTRAVAPRVAFAVVSGLSVLYMASYLFGITGRIAAVMTAALGFGALTLGYLLYTRR